MCDDSNVCMQTSRQSLTAAASLITHQMEWELSRNRSRAGKKNGMLHDHRRAERQDGDQRSYIPC